ncbi:hypothetical protein T484DRAFT_1878135 [Baffinella frigidus]|nr:hypothetical protein T484DRAFT_1878135 [Cryptophyta sp. CCMP2293]
MLSPETPSSAPSHRAGSAGRRGVEGQRGGGEYHGGENIAPPLVPSASAGPPTPPGLAGFEGFSSPSASKPAQQAAAISALGALSSLSPAAQESSVLGAVSSLSPAGREELREIALNGLQKGNSSYYSPNDGTHNLRGLQADSLSPHHEWSPDPERPVVEAWDASDECIGGLCLPANNALASLDTKHRPRITKLFYS